MTSAARRGLVSVDEYLAGELTSPVKHEYVGGVVYARTGARNAHNLIAANILGALVTRLRGRRCRAYTSDTKIRLRMPTQVRFYYPDVPVICRPNAQTDSFQDEPTVIFEVLSRRTRRIDEGEKRDAYLTIPSLAVYVLVEQELAAVTALRRTEAGFVAERHEGLDSVLPLPEIEVELPLAEIYDTVELTPEPDDTDVP